MRESMVFYRSFHEATKNLPQKQYKEVLNAIFEYALNGTEPKLSAITQSIFLLIKPQIDANNKRFENGCKGSEYGKLGGRPRKNPKKTPPKPQENPTKTPNVNVNENVNVNDIYKRKSKNKFCDYQQADVDFAALERKVFKN